ncbi:Hypothetical predicted protein [Octopus vulgaris]|uniref:Uncharacterized protein n=1 Tax=Octopus vulgaris TaxID=6645 RepID=A0AA36ATW1_OCTVU|nr:Hypothetical predicted protein [Octopus vulgaris]
MKHDGILEYFEKKRQNRKMNNFRSPNKKHGVSQDLIALHTLNAAYPGFLKEKTNQTKKLIRKVDIDKGKHQVKRFQEIELPHSPIENPSKLSLEDATSWNINTQFMQRSKKNTHSRISTEDDSFRSKREVYNKKGLMPVYSETDYSYATDHSISETYSSPKTQLSGFAVVPTLCKNETMEPIESSESSFTEDTPLSTSLIATISFLCDIFTKLNDLNKLFQRNRKTLVDCKSFITTFISKLLLYKTNVSKCQFHQFPQLDSLKDELIDENLTTYHNYLESLHDNMVE